jgi:hypothetical protein
VIQRRTLNFSSYGDVIRELEHLEKAGYVASGAWNLGQICQHLAYYYRGSLDGFDFRLPWLIRKFLGRPMLRKMLREGKMKAGLRTVPASVPPADVDEATAVQEAKELLGRLQVARQLKPSPLFDELSPDQWRELHLTHAAHHLSFLEPKPS